MMLWDPRRWRSRTTDEIPWWGLPLAIGLCLLAVVVIAVLAWGVYMLTLYLLFGR